MTGGWVAKCMKQQPRWVGRVGFAGDAVNPSLEAWPPHPCGGHSREPNPPRPLTVSCGRPPRKEEGSAERVARFACSERSMAPLYRKHCRIKQKGRGESRVLFPFHQFVSNPMLFPTVTGKLSGVGRCGLAGPLAPWASRMRLAGWAGRPTPVLPCAQDSAREQGAIEPPWARALCLRSTASQAPERTAASGWAGPRRGVYGVSCQPTPPHPTRRNPEPLWLLTLILTLPAAGGPPRVSAAPPHPGRSGSSRRCRRCRSSRSGSSPGTAGGNPRRSSTPVPGTRSRW